MPGHAPQSTEQPVHDSPGSQMPLPQLDVHPPQSATQVAQVSPPLHAWSPQPAPAQVPQSAAQLAHVSVESHTASPHTLGHAPQSNAQVEHDSLASQIELPQPV
jgi:hypothetical protein